MMTLSQQICFCLFIYLILHSTPQQEEQNQPEKMNTNLMSEKFKARWGILERI